MTKLNPCPNCGSEPDVVSAYSTSFVHCNACDHGLSVKSKSVGGAMNAWNAATMGDHVAPTEKTLRDEFAMAAMQAIRSGPEWQLLEMKSIVAGNSDLNLEGVISHFAYKQADAMIKERSK